MYRPKGFKNPNADVLKMEPADDGAFHSSYNILKIQYAHYEAGADAMLEGLRKDGSDIPEGKMVFIPDEER